jgi:hypothetical protein
MVYPSIFILSAVYLIFHYNVYNIGLYTKHLYSKTEKNYQKIRKKRHYSLDILSIITDNITR